jgi:hypothetical protein
LKIKKKRKSELRINKRKSSSKKESTEPQIEENKFEIKNESIKGEYDIYFKNEIDTLNITF